MAGMKRTRTAKQSKTKRRKMGGANAASSAAPRVSSKWPQMTFRRKWRGATWIPNTQGYWRLFNVSLGDMPVTERNEIINMFDQYKITRVTVEIVPRFINFDAGLDPANPVPTLHWYVDNSGFPTTPTAGYDAAVFNTFSARANNGYISETLDHIVKFSFVPTVTTTTDQEVKTFPWTSVNNTSVVANAAQGMIVVPNFAVLKNTSEFDIMYTLDIKGRALR